MDCVTVACKMVKNVDWLSERPRHQRLKSVVWNWGTRMCYLPYILQLQQHFQVILYTSVYWSFLALSHLLENQPCINTFQHLLSTGDVFKDFFKSPKPSLKCNLLWHSLWYLREDHYIFKYFAPIWVILTKGVPTFQMSTGILVVGEVC